MDLLYGLRQLKHLRKHYETSLYSIGFNSDLLESQMNSINENVAELQKITHIQDTYYPYLEILYYEEMRDQIDNEAALEALKKELEKLLNNSDEQQINCNTLEKIIDNLTAETIAQTEMELEESRERLEQLEAILEEKVDRNTFNAESLMDKADEANPSPANGE